MRHIAYRFLAAISPARGGTGALARPSRAELGGRHRPRQLSLRRPGPWCAALVMSLVSSMISSIMISSNNATAETRPHYGGTLRVMLQSAPGTLDLPANTMPANYWDMARTLSQIGDTLVRMDAQGRPQPALAVAWQSDATARHWQLTLRRGVKFHDGSAASPTAIAQILGALHPGWTVRAPVDSVSINIDSESHAFVARRTRAAPQSPAQAQRQRRSPRHWSVPRRR